MLSFLITFLSLQVCAKVLLEFLKDQIVLYLIFSLAAFTGELKVC